VTTVDAMELQVSDPLHWDCRQPVTWTTVNFSEAVPGVVTPLGWTFWHLPFERALRRTFYDLGAYPRGRVMPDPPPEQRASGVFFGRVAGNVDLLRDVAAALPGSSPNGFEFQLFGSVREGMDNRRNLRRYPIAMIKAGPTLALARRRLYSARAEATAWWSSTTAAAPQGAAEAADRLRQTQQVFQTVMGAHLLVSMLAQAAFEQTVKLASSAGLPELSTSLFTSATEVESTSMSTALWEVSRQRLSLEEFLAVYGYHGPNVGELGSVSWREDARPVLRILDAYRRMGEDESPSAMQERQAETRRAAEAKLLAALGPLGRAKATALLAGRRLLPLREAGKSGFVQVLDAARFLARGLGRILVEEGEMDDPDDVLYLTMDEICGGLRRDLRPSVSVRRRWRSDYENLELPALWTGAAKAVPVPAATGDGDCVTGIGVAPGVVDGTVRLLTDPAECSEPLHPGEILVCTMTDPSWAAIMLTAGGLVIDVGGPISHGAIVARELGIPCVINTRTGTRQLGTGDRVRVDGNLGEVTILARAPATTD
jgi:phosphohistidine swiveling domain-containing protein